MPPHDDSSRPQDAASARISPSRHMKQGLDNHTRYGYSLSVLKRRDFAQWQVGIKLSDTVLCKAISEMASGLIDADLGGSLYKKRVARPGAGKSNSYRTLVSAQLGQRYVFLHGYSKSDKANITREERKALQFSGKVFLELSPENLAKALQAGILLEVFCDEQNH